MAVALYPMKFNPIYKDKLWGGRRIKEMLGLDYGKMPNCGEAWMLSGVWGEQSIVANGDFAGDEINDLVETFMGDLVGESVFDRYGEQFPILFKIIDSNAWLSVQVHPDDDLAQQRGYENGKTEMWYVMFADKGAELITGFNKQIDRRDFVKIMEKGNIEEYLHLEDVHEGDVFFIPAGRIHALGPDMMVAEVQQTSDVTYRIYDWDRIDVAGMKRELHVPQALDALDFDLAEDYKTHYPNVLDKSVNLVDTEYFVTNVLQLDGTMQKDYSDLDSFVVLMSVKGNFTLSWENGSEFVRNGECILIPNQIKKVEIIADTYCKLMEVYINIKEE